MARQNPVGRLDDMYSQLEQLHRDVHDIFDHHVEELRCQTPGVPFGVIKATEMQRLGSDLDYLEAIKMLRRKLVGAPERGAA
jgi:hypothetical protein